MGTLYSSGNAVIGGVDGCRLVNAVETVVSTLIESIYKQLEVYDISVRC